MTEFQKGIFNLIKRSSLARAIVYTIGHILIAMTCNHLITGAEWGLAAADALIEPLINGVWFYALDKMWVRYG